MLSHSKRHYGAIGILLLLSGCSTTVQLMSSSAEYLFGELSAGGWIELRSNGQIFAGQFVSSGRSEWHVGAISTTGRRIECTVYGSMSEGRMVCVTDNGTEFIGNLGGRLRT